MSKESMYWVGKKPTDGRRWAYTNAAVVLNDPAQIEAVFRMYRRYVKKWNEIELDKSRSLSEHTHEICGAKVVGANRKFTIHAHEGSKNNWILEIIFARGFSQFHPGWSTGKNALRSVDDIKGIYLHWSDEGKESFEKWLLVEYSTNHAHGEWTEYKSK